MKMRLTLLVGVSMLAAAGLGYAASHENHGTMATLDSIEWQEIRPGSSVSVAVLWGDPSAGANIRLIKLPAGHVAPNHAHTGDYHGVNLAGTWRHTFLETGDEQALPPGSYVYQPGTEMHGNACDGDEDCVLFIQMNEAADFIPQEQ